MEHYVVAFPLRLLRFDLSMACVYHVTIGKIVVIFPTFTHVASILFYLHNKRENIIKPVMHSDKLIAPNMSGSVDNVTTCGLALALLLACAAAVHWLVNLEG